MSGEANIPFDPDWIHELKCWPEYFQAILDGTKTFEIRKDDRGFAVGHILRLREWDGAHWGEEYTGREVSKRVSYVLPGGKFGIADGYVALALSAVERTQE